MGVGRIGVNLFLDTHVLIWLYQRDGSKFSIAARALLDESQLYMPALSFLELQFLREIRRITFTAEELYTDLSSDLLLNLTDSAVITLTKKAVELDWTRDPFDRLIVAEAIRFNARLMTRDLTIHANFSDAIWL
jgi:PIN domain nuclease of toxin-antitoxin system